LAAPRVEGERFHYFETGIKRVIIELELENVSIFLVHLSLKFRHRQDQLRHLHELVKRSRKPVIVAGDFNTFWGDHELYLFMEASGLRNANRLGLSSYPSRNPRKELDFILHSKGIEITHFDVPDVRFSDHRPLICDFEVRGSSRESARQRRTSRGSLCKRPRPIRRLHIGSCERTRTVSRGSRSIRPARVSTAYRAISWKSFAGSSSNSSARRRAR